MSDKQGNTQAPVQLRVLYFEGCPNHPPAVQRLRAVAERLGVDVDLKEVEVKPDDDVHRLGFRGSPTVQINGVDLDPAERGRDNCGFGCRMYGGAGVPDAAMIDQFTLYVGPMDETNLAKAEAGLEDAHQIFLKRFIGPIAQLMLNLLQGFYQIVPNYGVAIILLTLVVKLLTLPLYHKQMASMKKMQALQPQINALREQYKDDPQKLQKEQMELFRKHKVNPLAGCLPFIIILPIFIALYATFNLAVELRGAPFLGWINDLSSPDRAFYIPIGTWILPINILPVAYSVMMFINMSQNKMEGPNAAAMRIMPFIFIFFFWSIASGVILYFVVNILIDVIQRRIMDKFQKDEPALTPKPASKGGSKK